MSTAMDHRTLESECDRLVSQNVNTCLSALVSVLARGHGSVNLRKSGNSSLDADIEAMHDLTNQAAELCAPLLDYESAAEEAIYHFPGRFLEVNGQSAAEFCDLHAIDPYEREILEHWSVSKWLAEKLQAKGERIDMDFAGLCVWGRTIAGQSIAMDSVIQDIVKELHA